MVKFWNKMTLNKYDITTSTVGGTFTLYIYFWFLDGHVIIQLLNFRIVTMIKTSGLIGGNSAAIKCLSSTLEKSPVYKILRFKFLF